MIQISENAKKRVLEILNKENKSEDHFVRVDVTSGGCSGLSYDLKFDNQMIENDEIFEDKGIKLVVSKRSMLYLIGTVLEFSDGLNGKGFFFNNPNAARTCACGESFSL